MDGISQESVVAVDAEAEVGAEVEVEAVLHRSILPNLLHSHLILPVPPCPLTLPYPLTLPVPLCHLTELQM